MNRIRIGICGYGNLGKGVELATINSKDMELIGIFSRRENIATREGKTISIDKLMDYSNKIDVLILCGGSATDLPKQSVELVQYFNIVDSFDTHARIPEHYSNVDKVAKDNNKIGIISVGWDPGILSIARGLFGAILPSGENYTFWGKGVSQGHSDAVRRINGVLNARQYTIPKEKAVESVKAGLNPKLKTRDKHTRECFVVISDDADKEKIEKEIKNMPNYFADYDTIVHFISQEEMQKNHSRLPHGGTVLRSGDTYSDNKHVLEFTIKLDSNSEFTGSIMTCYARAAYQMAKEGHSGCMTVYDIPLAKLSPMSNSELRKELL